MWADLRWKLRLEEEYLAFILLFSLNLPSYQNYLFASSFFLPAYLSLAFYTNSIYSFLFSILCPTSSVFLFLFLSFPVPYVAHCIRFTLFPTSYSYFFIHSYPLYFKLLTTDFKSEFIRQALWLITGSLQARCLITSFINLRSFCKYEVIIKTLPQLSSWSFSQHRDNFLLYSNSETILGF